ncbi:MAG: lipopolysaccharide heptosyltransferase II, partial [Gammaproteobacteria bacterium]
YGTIAALQGSPAIRPLTAASRLRILVIRLDLLGDVVLSIPAIEALAAALPAARIDALALPYTAPILRRVSAVTTVHELDIHRYRRPRGWLKVGDLIRTIRRIRAEHYDLAIGLSGLMGGLFSALSGARWRVGYELETFRGCYNLPVRDRRYLRRQHEVEYCLDLVRSLGVHAEAGAIPRLGPSTGGSDQPSRTAPAHDLRLATPPYAVLVPGASNGAAKRWPPLNWARLGNRLAREAGLNLVIVGSASERALAQGIVDQLTSPAVNLTGSTSIDELISLLTGAELVVAGDTGPLHVAAAVGTPVVGIYGPTDPMNSGPRGEHAAVVRLGLPCSPCYDLRSPADCKLPDRSAICMSQLSAERVLEAIARVLRRDRDITNVFGSR